ncbi:MAG: hypothetical protein J7L39_02050, partial [Candidatus Aenigmarchaeota archaeon]|nr:hypothetical protein [Candidatus Aenigmarchaeota archaeon]
LFSFMLLRNYSNNVFNKEESIREKFVGRIVNNIEDEEIVNLVQNGNTIVKIKFNHLCQSCLSLKEYLESLMENQDYKKQMTLVEILDSNISKPWVEIISPNENEILTTENKEEIQKVLCKALVDPPIDCVLL